MTPAALKEVERALADALSSYHIDDSHVSRALALIRAELAQEERVAAIASRPCPTCSQPLNEEGDCIFSGPSHGDEDDEPGNVDAPPTPSPNDWDSGAEAMREACAQRADAEEDPEDTVPPDVYEHLIEVGPFSAAKGAVRATKKAIAKGIRALPIPARPK